MIHCSNSHNDFHEKKWFFVHTYSGFEQKVKTNLEERVKTLNQEEYFGRILVPTEQVIELKKGQKKTSSRKFYPGYIMVQMVLNEETWHTVTDTAKVTGFVGGGNMPSPIPEMEAEKIILYVIKCAWKILPKLRYIISCDSQNCSYQNISYRGNSRKTKIPKRDQRGTHKPEASRAQNNASSQADSRNPRE